MTFNKWVLTKSPPQAQDEQEEGALTAFSMVVLIDDELPDSTEKQDYLDYFQQELAGSTRATVLQAFQVLWEHYSLERHLES